MTVFAFDSTNVGVTVVRGTGRKPHKLVLRVACPENSDVPKASFARGDVEKTYKMSWRRAKAKMRRHVAAVGAVIVTKEKS